MFPSVKVKALELIPLYYYVRAQKWIQSSVVYKTRLTFPRLLIAQDGHYVCTAEGYSVLFSLENSIDAARGLIKSPIYSTGSFEAKHCRIPPNRCLLPTTNTACILY